MPLYFVDINDGQITTHDDAGSDASSPEVARDEAVRLVTEVAKAAVGSGSEQLLVATVRDEAEQEVYQITMSLTCQRSGQPPALRQGGRGDNGAGPAG